MNKYQRTGLIVAVLIVAFMALFPPRKPAPQARTANFESPRVFLFSSTMNKATRQLRASDGTSGESSELVEIDAGRLLAEILLVFTALLIWYLSTESFKGRVE